MTAQTSGEVNHSPGASPPDLSSAEFWFLLSLFSMASPQVELLLQYAFPKNSFVTHETNLSHQGRYLMFGLCLACSDEISFAFVASVHDRGDIHSNTSKRKPKQSFIQ